MNPIDLPSDLGSDTEWTSDAGTNYRFTNSAPNEWIVHRAYDHGFVAHLRRAGSVYDLVTETGNPSFSAITVSLSRALSLLT